MSKIDDGWNFMINQMETSAGALQGQQYVQRVKEEISDLFSALQMDGSEKFNLQVDQLKGFSAETWHAGTFNIDSALKGNSNRAYKLAENGHASVDIKLGSGEEYSLKYYKTAEESAKHQAWNVKQAYSKYLSEAKQRNAKDTLSFTEYCDKYGYNENDIYDVMQSVYRGQGRIIPSDQLEQAKEYLREKIAKEASQVGENRRALYRNYLDTLESITDHIEDKDGTVSYRLTKEQSEKLAQMSKDQSIDLEQFGITTDKLITNKFIINQALKSGYTSAVISLVLQVAPEIFKAIEYAINNDGINVKKLKELGLHALSIEAKGFICGAASSALTISCQAGKLGVALTRVDAPIIGTMTVLLLNTIENSFKVAVGQMKPQAMGIELSKELLISGASIGCGYLFQMAFPELPVLGYMLGSFVGSTMASLIVGIAEKTIISYCVDSGFTCFGLVEQDYVIPQEALEVAGIEVFEYKKFKYEKFQPKSFQFKKFEPRRFAFGGIEIYPIRRGMIGVRKVGYTY